jgi:hypothetical protein
VFGTQSGFTCVKEFSICFFESEAGLNVLSAALLCMKFQHLRWLSWVCISFSNLLKDRVVFVKFVRHCSVSVVTVHV